MVIQIPVWEKFTLSIEEAAAYFRIGENRNADFILWNGNRPQIKRQKFETIVNNVHDI